MDKKLIPFLKWAGGKRWFSSSHAHLIPSKYNRYIEPFLGGGSIFFYLKPEKALLGDVNEELIATYTSIRDNWEKIVELLYFHEKNHSDKYYYEVRDSNPIDLFDRASRLIYLNRTCFNGIYRVNLQGKFNVPKGTKNTVIYNTDDFKSISEVLMSAELRISDFEALIDEAQKDDFIFADPPYTVTHNLNGFIKYNEKLFSWYDQVRLAKALARAKRRGVKIISTNANHDSVCELYEERKFDIKTVSRFSSISATPQSRNKFEELIIMANI